MKTEVTVYIVDDDEAILKTMSRALEKRGYRVKTFKSAVNFLERYEASYTGCIVLDLNMPQMDGLDLQQELNARKVSLPIIFITGQGGVPESVKALKAGAIDFLEKPFRQAQLIECIEEAFFIDSKNRQDENEQSAFKSKYQKLTGREKEVLNLIITADGKFTSKTIARQLGISHRTVDHHKAKVLQKMSMSSVQELVAYSEPFLRRLEILDIA